MQCPRCQHENRLQARFCEECAGPLTGASPVTRSHADDLKAEVAYDAAIFRREGDRLRLAAHHGPIPTGSIAEFTLPLVRGSMNGRSVLEGCTIHVADVQTEVDEFPEGSEFARQLGFRAVL
jgi:hypothetical protein